MTRGVLNRVDEGPREEGAPLSSLDSRRKNAVAIIHSEVQHLNGEEGLAGVDDRLYGFSLVGLKRLL